MRWIVSFIIVSGSLLGCISLLGITICSSPTPPPPPPPDIWHTMKYSPVVAIKLSEMEKLCDATVIVNEPYFTVVLAPAHCYNKSSDHTDIEGKPNVTLFTEYFDITEGQLKKDVWSSNRYEVMLIHPDFDPGNPNMMHDYALLIFDYRNSSTDRLPYVPNLFPLGSDTVYTYKKFDEYATLYYIDPHGDPEERQMKLVNESTCRSTYPYVNYSSQLCATDSTNTIQKGHSGSPLVCKSHFDTCPPYLCGIVSYGNEDPSQGSPVVFTDVSKLLTRIIAEIFKRIPAIVNSEHNALHELDLDCIPKRPEEGLHWPLIAIVIFILIIVAATCSCLISRHCKYCNVSNNNINQLRNNIEIEINTDNAGEVNPECERLTV